MTTAKHSAAPITEAMAMMVPMEIILSVKEKGEID